MIELQFILSHFQHSQLTLEQLFDCSHRKLPQRNIPNNGELTNTIRENISVSVPRSWVQLQTCVVVLQLMMSVITCQTLSA